MNTRPILATTAILACTACAEPTAPAQSPTQAPAMAQAPSGPVAPPSAATAPQPASGRGNIVGRIATNPWRALKEGGVVYLEDGPKDGKAPLSGILDNHDMTFMPKIAVITAGGSIIFTNTDPLMHNVFTPDGDKWNLGEIPQNGSVVKRFDAPQVYTVLCNLHPNMLAYLVVTPSSYFARIDDADGSFVLKNVPPGTYHATAWVPRLKPVTQAITVTGNEVTLNFDLER